MGVGHYENFPLHRCWRRRRCDPPSARSIASPHRRRLADEGDAPAAERLQALAGLREQLDRIEDGSACDWPDLAAAIQAHALPLARFRDLLSHSNRT